MDALLVLSTVAISRVRCYRCAQHTVATLAKRSMRPPRKRKVVSSNLTGGCAVERFALSLFFIDFGMVRGGPKSREKNYQKRRGQGGIEPPTSPTLKENHTTRPLARR